MQEFIDYIKYFVESGVDTFLETDEESKMQNKNSGDLFELLSPQVENTKINTKDKAKDKVIELDESESRLLANSAKSIEELEQIVRSFDGCALKKTAKSCVFGNGSINAEIMFIGEAPGANEDEQGIPFCGQSGKLLDNIVKSIGLKRENVYITNTIFWRPPANRRPTAEEIKICRPFVEKHIQFISPKLIVLVGSTAVESLLTSQVSMHHLRQNFFEYTNQYLDHTIKTAVIFHPSYLLRQPYKKKLMWYDMYRLKQQL